MPGGTNNLNLDQMGALQSSPEVTHNNSNAELDAAMTNAVSLTTTGGITLTQNQYTRNMLFNVSTSGASDTVTIFAPGTPVLRSLTIWKNTSTHAVTLAVGTTSVTLGVGVIALVMTDGTANGLIVLTIGYTAGQAYDLNTFVSGTMSNNQEVLRFNARRAFTLPSGLTGSNADAGVAATASTTLTMKKNGSSIGTLVWSASGTVAAITFSSAVSFAVGDVFTIDGPATADATLANIAVNLLGQR